MTLRLNLGAGKTEIEGFTSIDIKDGKSVFPLAYGDNSVDEIRASHILEHFPHWKIHEVLQDWLRTLKPGGRIRLAVPDFDKIKEMDSADDMWDQYIMGGQADDNDYHRSVFTEKTLRHAMTRVGIDDIQDWVSSNTDCAAMPISLNLEGVKQAKQSGVVKIAAVMSLPRVGWNDAWGEVMYALAPFKIPIRKSTGAFWGQCMQRTFEGCVADGLDWILTIDYDSMFTAKHLDVLMGEFGGDPEIDALAALQCRRGSAFPLMTQGTSKGAVVTGDPLKVTTAHFGLTLIRVDALKKVEKPWFWAKPDKDDGWGEGRLDDDIWFWHQWRKAGNTIYNSTTCRIGHLELLVSDFDADMNQRHQYVNKWRERNDLKTLGGDHAKVGFNKDVDEKASGDDSGAREGSSGPASEQDAYCNVVS